MSGLSSRQESRTAGWIEKFLPLATVAAAFLLAFRRLDDSDTWWHLASGRWIVENKTVPTTDTLSFTVPDHPWINLQWFYDVVLYGLFEVGGPSLLVVVAACCFCAAAYIARRILRVDVGEAVACFFTLWAVLVSEERYLIRPEMFSLPLLVLVLYLLHTAKSSDGRWLWLLPFLMLVWVNSHSLFIIGLVCIVGYVSGAALGYLPFLPRLWKDATVFEPPAFRRLLVAAVASVLVAAVNPYGLEGLAFPIKLLTRIDGSTSVFQSIGEFRSPFSTYFTTWTITAYQALFFFCIALVVTAALISLVPDRRRGRAQERPAGFDLATVGIFVGLAYVSTLARRNVALFALGSLPAVGMALALLRDRASVGMQRLGAPFAKPFAALVLVCACTLISLTVTNYYYAANEATHAFGLGVYETNFPAMASAKAAEYELPEPLYNDLSAGGYLTWDNGIGDKVFIDGRLEVYDNEFFRTYQTSMSNYALWKAEADAFGLNSAIIFHRWPNRDSLIASMNRDPEWSLIYHDETAVVFVRTAGNEAVVGRARKDFIEGRTAHLERAKKPRSLAWQWPVEEITALRSYARLLWLISDLDGAIDLYQHLITLRLTTEQESSIRYRMAYLLARMGRMNEAQMHIEASLELNPDNENAARLLERIKAFGA